MDLVEHGARVFTNVAPISRTLSLSRTPIGRASGAGLRRGWQTHPERAGYAALANPLPACQLRHPRAVSGDEGNSERRIGSRGDRDYPHLNALVAPGVQLTLSPDNCCFRADPAAAPWAMASQVFRLLDAANRFGYHVIPTRPNDKHTARRWTVPHSISSRQQAFDPREIDVRASGVRCRSLPRRTPDRDFRARAGLAKDCRVRRPGANGVDLCARSVTSSSCRGLGGVERRFWR